MALPQSNLSKSRKTTYFVLIAVGNVLFGLTITAMAGIQPWWVYGTLALLSFGGAALAVIPGVPGAVWRFFTAIVSTPTVKNFIIMVMVLAVGTVIHAIETWEGPSLGAIIREGLLFARLMLIGAIVFLLGILSRLAEHLIYLAKKQHFTFGELVLLSGGGAHLLSPRELDRIYEFFWVFVDKGDLKVSPPDGGDISNRHDVRVSRDDLRDFIEGLGEPVPPFLLDGWLNIIKAAVVQFASGALRVRKRGTIQLTWLDAHDD